MMGIHSCMEIGIQIIESRENVLTNQIEVSVDIWKKYFFDLKWNIKFSIGKGNIPYYIFVLYNNILILEIF